MAYKMYVASGEKIRKMRLACGLSEEDLAKELGCGKEHIRLIEGCTRKISPAMAEKLSRCLGCYPESILCMEEGILEQAGAPVRAKRKKQDKNRKIPAGKGGKEAARIRAAADRIIEARKTAGLTQKEFAAMLGISSGTVSAIERGTADVPPEAMEKLCRYFSMPASYFQGEPSPLDISIRVHNSCLLQRLNTAAMECNGSPDSIDLAAKMLVRQGGKPGTAGTGKIVT